MTLEDALGRPIQDLEDTVLAYVMFDYVKHGHDNPLEAARVKIDGMTNTEFLAVLSIALESMNVQGIL